jgi:mono/diheme cytochrome c family protein
MRSKLYIFAVILVLAGLLSIKLWPKEDPGPPAPPNTLAPDELVARGAYLAKAGDCMACHTVRGGLAYAGGLEMQTPFGAVLTPNITPDRQHGIGNWTADDFWRALHNGKSRNGRLLYPAFPYTDYTRVTRADADALYAYLRTVPPQAQPNSPHRLRFPYNQQLALAAWRALYFQPGVYREDSKQSIEWNRGAYLVQGLGHCSACHSGRNALGAANDGLGGGIIPIQGWYAPALTSDAEAGLGDWDTQHVVALLKTGVSPRATVFGPMATVVRQSLQHLDEPDIRAMAVYLKTLPQPARKDKAPLPPPTESQQAMLDAGASLYDTHCVKCHMANGQGKPPGYPPLAGNRALTTDNAANAIRIVLNGGFAPGTAGNPRPYGMPPFGHVLDDTQAAAVVSYLRNSWGNRAPLVSPLDVNKYRNVPMD